MRRGLFFLSLRCFVPFALFRGDEDDRKNPKRNDLPAQSLGCLCACRYVDLLARLRNDRDVKNGFLDSVLKKFGVPTSFTGVGVAAFYTLVIDVKDLHYKQELQAEQHEHTIELLEIEIRELEDRLKFIEHALNAQNEVIESSAQSMRYELNYLKTKVKM